MNENTKPTLTIKANGSFVGSGWTNEGLYGTYYSVKIDKDLPAGTTIYVSPRKNSGVELQQ